MKHIIIIAGLISAVGLCAAKTGKRSFQNLKVLPKDISSKDLQGIMADDFEDGLGVSCGFCHAPAAGGHGLDFVSDARPEKEIARRMMRMTLDLNRKYFNARKPRIGSDALTITCATCHKGQPFPDGDILH
jgi:Photosynthetic reaction centre cytochrome C subunit